MQPAMAAESQEPMTPGHEAALYNAPNPGHPAKIRTDLPDGEGAVSEKEPHSQANE